MKETQADTVARSGTEAQGCFAVLALLPTFALVLLGIGDLLNQPTEPVRCIMGLIEIVVIGAFCLRLCAIAPPMSASDGPPVPLSHRAFIRWAWAVGVVLVARLVLALVPLFT